MASYGTTQKCKACDKTVHFVEMISADGIPYHNTCFKCTHCSGRLAMSNYSAVDGQLYCRPHFEQLFKETGSFTSKKSPTPGGKQGEQNKGPSRLSSFFSGTQEKCAVCQKTVYPLEKVTVEGEFYHKPCFKCAHGGCLITPSSYAALDGTLYCKPHFAQLFKEKGSYSNLNKKKTSTDTTPVESEVEPEPEPEPEPESEPKPDPEPEPDQPGDSTDDLTEQTN